MNSFFVFTLWLWRERFQALKSDPFSRQNAGSCNWKGCFLSFLFNHSYCLFYAYHKLCGGLFASDKKALSFLDILARRFYHQYFWARCCVSGCSSSPSWLAGLLRWWFLFERFKSALNFIDVRLEVSLLTLVCAGAGFMIVTALANDVFVFLFPLANLLFFLGVFWNWENF